MALPLRTISEANARGSWHGRARRAKALRGASRMAVEPRVGAYRRSLAPGAMGSVVVTLERLAPSPGLDDDNLRAALKAVRDGVADALGLSSDRDPRVTWLYAQADSRALVRAGVAPMLVRGYGVRVRVED